MKGHIGHYKKEIEQRGNNGEMIKSAISAAIKKNRKIGIIGIIGSLKKEMNKEQIISRPPSKNLFYMYS